MNNLNKKLFILPIAHLIIAFAIITFYLSSPDNARINIWLLLVKLDWPISFFLEKIASYLQISNHIAITLLIIFGTIW